MKLIKNSGNDRVLDELRKVLAPQSRLDVASPFFSLFAFAEIRDLLEKVDHSRLVLPTSDGSNLNLLGIEPDRPFRNQLQARWLASQCAQWIEKKTEVRGSPKDLPQSIYLTDHSDPNLRRVIAGNCPFTTDGLGLTPGNQFSLIQCSENVDEVAKLGSWFSALWDSLPGTAVAKNSVMARLKALVEHKAPSLIYFLILYHLFKDLGDELDEEKIVKSATGIRNTNVWKKLYKFQRDGVVGAIDKLERHGGCIIADSVGLGKTFEALAIIKYYELRNDRVLVLVPKRLRDNWTLYKANDRRNILAADRLNYDVLNHTDLSRDGGKSGDIDLSHVNWGNYDLVVIDESHNFRNKASLKDRETRYDRLMRKIIKEGVKTRVLMLSATPVNNRLADLRNQIAFVTEAEDTALAGQGIASVESTVRKAQLQFNRWLNLEEIERKPARLMDMLGFDYFKLLDLLTIARSRKHIEKYYGTAETGTFPDRLKPINIKSDVDRAGEFRAIREINNEIRRLNLSAYAPLRYVLPGKQAAYDAKYSTAIRGGESVFRQADREESLVHLLRVNILKRMESSVVSFALTLKRQIKDVDGLLARIDAHEESVEELSIEDVEIDDAAFESLLAGRKVKVLLQDVDRVRWRQDLLEDHNRLATLLSAAQQIEPTRDAKLQALRELIASKARNPINPGNRKVIVFTAFADTADYLYRELSGWALKDLGMHAAIVRGTGSNKTTMPKLWVHLKDAGLVDAKGKVQDSLKKALKDGTLTLPEPFAAHLVQVKEMLRKLAGRLDIKNADDRKRIKTRQAVLQSAEFKALWDRIKHKTTYRVQFDNEALVKACTKAIQTAPAITATRLQWRKADLAIGKGGVAATGTITSMPIIIDESDLELPDLLTELQDRTQLTRRSIVTILRDSSRLDDFKKNPQQYIDLTADAINRAKRLALVDGIKYQRIGEEDYYGQELFEKEELTGYLKNMLAATKGVYEHVVYDSAGVEKSFAEALENNEAVKVYAKLPGWFKVPTPLGTYNPDWAVLVEKDGDERLYFVVETKGDLFAGALRGDEAAKIECGKAHFRALSVGENPARYELTVTLDALLARYA